MAGPRRAQRAVRFVWAALLTLLAAHTAATPHVVAQAVYLQVDEGLTLSREGPPAPLAWQLLGDAHSEPLPPAAIGGIVAVAGVLGAALLGVVLLRRQVGARTSELRNQNLQLLREVAQQRRGREEAARQVERLSLHSQLGDLICSARDLDEALQSVCRALADDLSVPQAGFALLDEARSVAEVIADVGRDGRPSALGSRIPVSGNPSMEHILAHREALVITDAQADPRLRPVHDVMQRRNIRSILIVPVAAGGQVIGTLGFDALEPHEFTADDVERVEFVAKQVGQLLLRKQSETLLHHEEARYRLLFENAPVPIMSLDRTGRLIEANPALLGLFGLDGGPVALGLDVFSMPGVVESGLAEDIRHCLERGLPQMTERRLRPEYAHSPRHLRIRLNPYRDDAGQVAGLQGIIEDLTEERLLEEQLRQVQKMEAIGRLAGGIAHDFNNLMTIITGCSEFILGQLPPGHLLREDAEAIIEAGNRAAALTHQLLAFSRRQVRQLAVLQVNDVLCRMSGILRRLIGENIRLTILPGDDVPPIQADANQIEQAIINLAVNARDAMPDGGTIAIETLRLVPDEAFLARHPRSLLCEHTAIRVSDTGPGLLPEAREHLFEPFFTTKELGRGTGLGLSTVYGIVQQGKGHVDVDSEPGQGTAFTLLFPAARTPLAPPAAEQAPDVVGGTETVLLVEDEEDVRRFAAQMLRRLGHRVLEAAGGQEAVEAFGRHADEIDVVLTDVVMPGMGGGELAQQLRALQPDVPVLFMSGHTDEVLARQLRRQSGQEILRKPFHMAQLDRRLRDLLTRCGLAAPSPEPRGFRPEPDEPLQEPRRTVRGPADES